MNINQLTAKTVEPIPIVAVPFGETKKTTMVNGIK